MLKSKTKWNFTYKDTDADEGMTGLAGVSDLTSQLLQRRGITEEDKAARFLQPSMKDFYDPYLLDGMKESIARVQSAIEQGEHILVYGDYDADGVSSTTVMIEALKKAGAICDYYIPNRFTEGYGPNEAAFLQAAEDGFSVIITVDNGIAGTHEAEVAKQVGIDLIITDHHEVQETLPDAFSIIHPKTSREYPFKELAGVGVAFKFAHALLGEIPTYLLDMVAIGTIADLVPLKDENRSLVYLGLKALNQSNRVGLRALKEVCGIDGEIEEETIGFTIGPRVNAVGRLQDASPAVDLFLTNDAAEAGHLAGFINELNQERQKIVTQIAKEAEELLLSGEQPLNEVIVVAKENWNPGVLGIVASKLVRQFDRPAIVLGIDPEQGYAKGSARSIDAFDLFQNCMEVRDQFIHFGGHAQAAGMTLCIENIDEVRKQLCEKAQEKLSEDDYQQVLSIEMSLDMSDVTIQQIQEINKLRPFGMGNPKPLFHFKEKPKELRLIGSRQNHLKLLFKKEQSKLEGIAFGMGDLYTRISPASELEVVGELGINEWNGRKNVQVMVKDLKVPTWQLFDYRGSKHLEKKLEFPADQNVMALTFTGEKSAPHGLRVIRVEDIENYLHTAPLHGLVLLDLPEKLTELSSSVQRLAPDNIYACYQVENSAFFTSWPTRDHFKWFYGMLMKRKSFDLKNDREKLSLKKGWNVGMIDFISQVFFELGFVKIKDGLLTVETNPQQKDLAESLVYQERKEQLSVEQALYYSTYKELKDWFEQQRKPVKEEVLNGL
ncbi:single-stranded-DNA-specific exonuclease RecJ [Halobacillus sp. A5]|uniref:single-stranded-DNA-specific exonuclease RecJ n=1 Tax=Halobacillus sp. A5 TaxID=2880263 RepID=UPI0020A63CAF|nr:single-stranded-DNA-specific exonuclease RecJ [Halobacillus sp. A5]MCP3025570.1 single-stranded-DNA-specific exonuclease RecJ [Halobacillus sp. A5]